MNAGTATATVALSGATGFIGRRLCAELLRQGYRVRALVRDAPKARRMLGTGIETINGSLDEHDALQRLVRGADALMHLAGAVRGRTLAEFSRVNVDGTRNLLEAAAQTGESLPILHFSSLAAREPHLSFYARSKHEAEALYHSRRAPSFVLRPPAVYGPGDEEMLPLFRLMAKTGIAPVAGSMEARVSLLHVDDLAGAAVRWLQHGRQLSASCELHDGHPGGYGWPDICEIVSRCCSRRVRPRQLPSRLLDVLATVNLGLSRVLGYAPMLSPGKLCELRHPNWVADNAGAYGLLGWQPRIGLEEGLKSLPDWL